MPHANLAHVTSALALVIALGGTGYAASAIPRGSVGTLQLKTDAVTSVKVKDRSLLATDFKSGQLPRGARGPAGPAGPLLSTLPSGRTIRGDFFLGGHSTSSGQLVASSVSWGLEVASSLRTSVVQDGDSATTECPGTFEQPEAARGFACFYVRGRVSTGIMSTLGTETASQGVFRFGAGIYAFSSEAGSPQVFGTWAVTAA